MNRADWLTDMVCYQVYLRSFMDSDGDGLGDLRGLIGQLDHIQSLGATAVWVSPFYVSPQIDGGYDVADPTAVDPAFGSMEDVAALIAEIHRRGMRILIEVIPNHVSSEHPWFAAAKDGDRRFRSRFITRSSPSGPPNNWQSVFGGSAWSRFDDGDWYLHLFDPSQPDLNWDHPSVPEEFARVIRLWLDLGVDGFRVDVAHGLAKPDGLPDIAIDTTIQRTNQTGDIRFNNPRVHEHLRGLRAVVDEYEDRVLLGEVWTDGPARLRPYVEDDQFHIVFVFALTEATWSAASFAAAIEAGIEAQGSSATWVLSNHDIDRHATRFGGGAVGRRRARAAAVIQLLLPGIAIIYQGDELGLENAHVPPAARKDPTWIRSGGADDGRDGVRIPLPWTTSGPGFGFTSGQPWLPFPEGWELRAVEAQESSADSFLALYRAVLRARKSMADRALVSIHQRSDTLVIEMADSAGDRGWLLVCNLGFGPVPLPPGQVVLRSDGSAGDALLPDHAALVQTSHHGSPPAHPST